MRIVSYAGALATVLPVAVAAWLYLPALWVVQGSDVGTRSAGPQPAGLHRLTAQQYRNSVRDVFGEDIEIKGRFEPEVRQNGLIAIGLSSATVTPSGAEAYVAMGRAIASQVVDEKHREKLLPCAPKDARKADSDCASATLAKYGRLLFRRPLSDAELHERVEVANTGAELLGDYHQGLAFGLTALLSAPQFLFREDAVEPGTGRVLRLDPHAKAARLSYFLWNTTPDEELMQAAETGQLNSASGYQKQVDRMLASPRLEAGVRAFFTDMLAFEAFDDLAKDPLIYPQVSTAVIRDAQEETLRTIADLLLARKGDYRDLFTNRTTYLTRNLGYAYRIPVPQEKGWMRYTYADNAPYAGILSQFSFTALHAHPGRSSATLRGKAVRELLLCQSVPKPPGNVNFTVVQDTDNAAFRTARARLTAHRTNPVCAGCHRITDPIGLAMENYDGGGMFRAAENGVPIDASGDLDGIQYSDLTGLGRAMHDDPGTPACVVSRAYSYALGRTPAVNDAKTLANLSEKFARDKYRFTTLMREIAVSDDFLTMPKLPAAENELSQAQVAAGSP